MTVPVTIDRSVTWWSISLVWAFGGLPASLRVADHGPNGRIGALLCGVIALAVVVLLRCRFLGPAVQAAALVAVGLLGELLTDQFIGRAPIAIVLIGVVVADASIRGPWFGPERSVDRLGPSLVGVAVAGGLWWATGSLVVVLLHGVVLGWCWFVGEREPSWSLAAPAAVAGRVGSGARGATLRLARGSRRMGAAGGARLRALGARLVGRCAEAGRSAGRWLGSRSNRPALWCGLVTAVAVAPIYPRLVTVPPVLIRGTNDIPGTITRAEWIQFWPFRMSVPHPGWSFALRALLPFFEPDVAVPLILATATGAAVVVLVGVARSQWDDLPALEMPFACAYGLAFLLLESPAPLVPTTNGILGRFTLAGTLARGPSFAALHQWATPTITMSMPFAFALFFAVVRVLRESETAGVDPLVARSHRRSLLALTIVGTLVQPASTLALAPAAPVYLLLRRTLRRSTLGPIVWSFVLPGALICVGMVWFLSTNVSPWEQATWLWRPFWSIRHFGLDRPVFFAIMLLYPICWWALGRRWWRDPGVQLAGLGLLISAVPFLLLEQTTVASVPDGDLGVAPLMSIIFLTLCSLRLLFVRLQEVWRDRPPRFVPPAWAIAAATFLLLMLCAGVLEWSSNVGLTPEL